MQNAMLFKRMKSHILPATRNHVANTVVIDCKRLPFCLPNEVISESLTHVLVETYSVLDSQILRSTYFFLSLMIDKL